MKAYKFRIYPNKEQTEKLEFALDTCRQAYNMMLGELNEQVVIDKAQIQAMLPDMKICEPKFRGVYSKTLQYECYRLFSNLSALRVLKQNKKKVGRLRFKGKGWFKTINYNQSGFKLDKENKRLSLSKIGNIKIKLHREVEGNIKQITIKNSIDKWYVTIITDAVIKTKCGDKVIGIDMSPSKFGVRSDGVKISMLKEIDVTLMKLKKSHRNLSRKKKGSKNRLKTRKQLQKNYWRLNNQKVNFYHQTSYKLVKECKLIGIEDLSIKGMMMGYYNAKNFQKSGWSTFINKYLIYKAESAGCQVWRCDRFEPTSKKCSCCGWINKELKLSDRTFNCSKCGLIIDRDLNAAINIKKTCRQGTCLCGVDSSTVEKQQESVLKQEATSFTEW